MPVYECLCEQCGQTTESLRSMADADKPIACEHCGGKKTHRTHSVFSAPSSSESTALPAPPCGRCGDPRGSCGF